MAFHTGIEPGELNRSRFSECKSIYSPYDPSPQGADGVCDAPSGPCACNVVGSTDSGIAVPCRTPSAHGAAANPSSCTICHICRRQIDRAAFCRHSCKPSVFSVQRTAAPTELLGLVSERVPGPAPADPRTPPSTICFRPYLKVREEKALGQSYRPAWSTAPLRLYMRLPLALDKFRDLAEEKLVKPNLNLTEELSWFGNNTLN